MTTSSKSGGARPASAYARFIPREELGDFASWQPGTFGDASDPDSGSAAAPAPQPPTPEQWAAQVAAARQTGYQEGYRDGLVALDSFKQSFAQQATSQIGALLDAFDRQLGEVDRQAAMAVARTAVHLARQVLRTELTQRPELVAQVAAEAVHAVMMSARHIAVQVHPQDLPLVAEGAAEALDARGARLQANPSIERGGVFVTSDVGAIDARLATRWAQAAAALGSDETLGDDPAGAVDPATAHPMHERTTESR